MRYRVRWDFAKTRPAHWAGADPQTFGHANEGFILDAADLAEARDKLREAYRLNPFYLSITPDQGGEG